MKHHILLLLVSLALFSFISETSMAAENKSDSTPEWTPFQASLFSPVQLFDIKKDVDGVRFSLLYAENAKISGLDIGAGVNRAWGMTGIQIAGVMNDTARNYTAANGIQIAGLGSTADNLSGIQIGGFGNGVTKDATGIQIGGVGNVAGTIHGIQIAGIYNLNYVQNSSVTGLQLSGLFSFAENVTGVQIGLFNECSKLNGVQIGILNHAANARFPFLPIINTQF